MSNYDKLFREKENNLPLQNSDMEKNWAAMETQLNSGTQSNSKDAKFNVNKLMKGLIVSAVGGLIASVIFITTKNNNEALVTNNLAEFKSFIKPPMPQLNVPYEKFTYDAEIGDTLFTKNGSIIIFPKNAVLNNKGQIVTGKIEIRTREFNDPLDYYMAGIPMTYDSAGVKYTFISSGMIDIKAYQNNELLFVNPNAKPQLNLVSTNKETNTNLYILDTATGQWINKGRDEVNDMAKTSQHNFNSILVKGDMLKENSENGTFSEELNKNNISFIKPIPPQKANGKNPILEILIDPASFKELLAYNNLKFEVLNASTETVGEDSKTEWDNVELLHDGESSNYIAKFSKGNKSVQYKVRPVLEGKDYEAAVSVYNEKIKSYNEAQKNRLADEQIQTAKLALEEKTIDDENKITEGKNELIITQNKNTELENKRVAELNVLIIERNKLMRKYKKTLDSLIDVREKSRLASALYRAQIAKTNDSIQRIILERINATQALNQNLLRSFTIDGFGYWNCDMPTYPNGIPLYASYVDENNIRLPISNINAASFGINRVLAFYNNNITVLPNTNHIIWSVYQNDFYYLTYKEYEKLKIRPDIKTITFKLNKYKGKSNNVDDLKRILYGS